MAIKSEIMNKKFPLGFLYEDLVFMLIGVSEKNRYVDGVRTDEVEGYNYSVVDLKKFDKISISVISKKSLITNDELQKSRDAGTQLYAEFINPTIKAYTRFKNGGIEGIYDSYGADDIIFVETN